MVVSQSCRDQWEGARGDVEGLVLKRDCRAGPTEGCREPGWTELGVVTAGEEAWVTANLHIIMCQ